LSSPNLNVVHNEPVSSPEWALVSKKQKEEEEQLKRATALPKNLSDLSKGLDRILQLSNPRLKEILIYSYGVAIAEVKKMEKGRLKTTDTGQI